ncbi:MAG TPA: lysophospholipid acyltransferase family protein [Geminicoccaceae bacterium]
MARRKLRLHRHPAAQAAIAGLIAGYIRLVDRTSRFELQADPAAVDLIRQRRPCIGVFWHGRMMMMGHAWHRLAAAAAIADPPRPCVIGSDHPDAILVARVMGHFGLEHVHGSNKRGGVAIFRNARRVLEAGRIAVMTPDGPRGPALECKPGIVRLAMRTGAPIVPVSFATSRARTLRTWDSFTLALPFGRGVLAVGAPLEVPAGGDPDAARRAIDAALTGLTEAAERAVHDLVPAPTS